MPTLGPRRAPNQGLHGSIADDTMLDMSVRVVLDSNVLVAGLRSRTGASFRLLELLRDGAYEIAISVPLILEYEAVLMRHGRQLGLSLTGVRVILDFICSVAVPQNIHYLWRPQLRDPKDEFALELAVAAGCRAIVTHNRRDFVGAERMGVEILAPGEFLRKLEEAL
jgi:putative PIN family toxin of toxin-antitoxin system